MVLFVAANTGMVYYVLEATKEVHTAPHVSTVSASGAASASSSTNGVALVGSSGAVIETAAARDTLPLFVAPVLPPKQLASLEVVSVTLYDYERDVRVTRLMRVSGVSVINSTHTIFQCGVDQLEIKNGAAHVVLAQGPSPNLQLLRVPPEQYNSTLATFRGLSAEQMAAPTSSFRQCACAADLTCAALNTDGTDAAALEAQVRRRPAWRGLTMRRP